MRWCSLFIKDNWRSTVAGRALEVSEQELARQAEDLGIVGGQTYDALIAYAAIKAGAKTLVTWNQRSFAAFQDQIEVLTPS